MRTSAAVVARAPGRVNLMGDHTDHTGGWCLPMAVDRWVEVAMEPEPGRRDVRLRSDWAGEEATVPLDVADPAAVEPVWARYVAGVVAQLRPAHGWTGTITSTVPVGSGLSSSAALEVACALALGADPADRLGLARLCQAAEHAARGVPTGLLDQLSCVAGVAGHALLLDCTSHEVEPVPLPPPEALEVVVVPGPSRDLAATPYATRVAELQRVEEVIGPLRSARLDEVARLTDPTLRRRARHVVTENQRVHDLAAALHRGDLDLAGLIVDESHRSLAEDFESSTPGLDHQAAALRAEPGVYGVRITGGGWGGSLVALARPGALGAHGWVVRAVDGARLARPGAG